MAKKAAKRGEKYAQVVAYKLANPGAGPTAIGKAVKTHANHVSDILRKAREKGDIPKDGHNEPKPAAKTAAKTAATAGAAQVAARDGVTHELDQPFSPQLVADLTLISKTFEFVRGAGGFEKAAKAIDDLKALQVN